MFFIRILYTLQRKYTVGARGGILRERPQYSTFDPVGTLYLTLYRRATTSRGYKSGRIDVPRGLTTPLAYL